MELKQSTRLSDRELEAKILGSKAPTLVVFSAKWCGPCRLMKPIVEELEQEYQNQVDFLVIDIEEYPKVSDKFMVLNLPTFLFYRHGKQKKRLKGMQDKQILSETLSHL